MKSIKIILTIIVLGVIGFFVFTWTIGSLENTAHTEVPTEATNQFVSKIEKDIESLRTASINSFSKNFYKDIQAELDGFHNDGYLEVDPIQNNILYKSLSKNLFSTYVPKFVNETYRKFEGSRWSNSDLSFIENEIIEIKQNRFFDAEKSSFIPKFNEIGSLISKYREIASFINSSKSYPTHLSYTVESKFPVDGAKKIVGKSLQYINVVSESRYIRNIKWLQESLEELPHEIYNKHLYFLEKQIKAYRRGYVALNSQAEFSRELYQPLLTGIREFVKYEIVSSSKYKSDYARLLKMLNEVNDEARIYFRDRERAKKRL